MKLSWHRATGIVLLLILLTLILSANRIVPFNAKVLTLKEAYALSLEEALKWDENIGLISVTSADKTDLDEIGDGTDGSRSFWNFEYGLKNSHLHYIIEINYGKVVKKTISNGIKVKNELIYPDNLKIDSPEMLNYALKKFNIMPGTDWARGYHFTLKKFDKDVVMAIIGLDVHNCFSKIYYNAYTGETILNLLKIME